MAVRAGVNVMLTSSALLAGDIPITVAVMLYLPFWSIEKYILRLHLKISLFLSVSGSNS